MNLPNNNGVITPRLLEELGTRGDVDADAPVDTLVRFESDEVLERFIQQEESIPADQQRFTIKRVLRSVHVVNIEMRLDALATLSDNADALGITQIDTNFSVHAPPGGADGSGTDPP